MNFRNYIIGVLTLVLLCTSGALVSSAGAENTNPTSAGLSLEQNARISSLQVPFVPNEGQVADARVKFYSRTFAGTVFVTDEGITYVLPQNDENGWVLKEEFIGSGALAPVPAGSPAVPVNYLTGNFQQSLSSYQEITLGEIYDRINVNLRAYGNNVEKVFTVSPGGDPAGIAVKVTGAESLSVNEQGELELSTGLGTVKMTSPVAYQIIDGLRVEVPVVYQLNGAGYGFQVGEYNHSCPLVIDPLLASTFLGGGNTETGYSITLDAAGNVYVAGVTKSDNFPTTTGGYDRTYNDTTNNDLFVVKLNSDLSILRAATYLGGSNVEAIGSRCLAVASSGEVYLTGSTKSSDFIPSGVEGYDTSFNDTKSANDVFIARLSGDLSQLLSATFLGGMDDDMASSLAIDGSGNIFVAGHTKSGRYESDTFPTTAGAYQENLYFGCYKGFIAKLNSNLTQLLASTYLGGSNTTKINCMLLDNDDNVYVGGETSWGNDNSAPFPTTEDAYDRVNNGNKTSDGFVSKLTNDLTQLRASTFLGTDAGKERIISIARGSDGKLYAACVQLLKWDFPTSTEAYQTAANGTNEILICKLNSDFTELNAATYLGGSGIDSCSEIILDSAGNIYIAGRTRSDNYPFTDGAYQTSKKGASTAYDVIVTRMKNDLSGPLLASTYFGGDASETLSAMAMDEWGNIYLTGSSSDLPVTDGAYQTACSGSSDAFVARLTGDLLALASAPDSITPTWPAGILEADDVTETELTLTWSGAVDNMGIAGYQVIKDDSVIDSVYAAVTSYLVTGLSAGSEYAFKVEAFDAAGNTSTDGPHIEVTTAADPPPTWPENSSLIPSNVTDTTLTLTWNYAEDNSAVTGYRIFRNTVEIATVSSAVYSYDVVDLTPASINTFKVEAGDDAGNWSTTGPSVEVTTANAPDTVPPYWPTGYKGVNREITSPTGYHLSWDAAADNVGVTAYRLYLCTCQEVDGTNEHSETVIATVDGDTLSYDYSDSLLTNTSHGFKVEAGDAAGNWMESPRPTTYVTISGQTGLSISGTYATTISGSPPVSSTGDSIASSRVTLNPLLKIEFSNNVVYDNVWNANKQCFTLQSVGGGDIPLAVFRISDDNNFEERRNVFVCPQESLTPATEYKITVSASFEAKNGSSLYYPREIFFTTAVSASSPPTWSDATLTASNVTGTGLTLTWTGAADSTGISGYAIFSGGDIIASVDGTATSFNVTGLSGGTTYNFQVQAFNAAGNWSTGGPQTSATTIHDITAPVWPSGSSLNISDVTSTGLALSWTGAEDDAAVANYRVYQNDTLIAAVSAATTTYTVTGLNPNTAYTFKVEAGDDADNWSTTGPIASATTLSDSSPPGWPVGSSLTPYNVLNTALSLSWDQAQDDVGVTGYKILIEGSLYTTVSGSTTTCNVVGLTAGTTYTFQIQAGDAAGNWSSDGPIATVTTAASGDLTGIFTVSPNIESYHTIGVTADGINTITVNSGITGVRNFTVVVNPVTANLHPGDEKAVFVLLRNGLQVNLNTVTADFDAVNTAAASFNVEPGDVVKVYLVDDLYTVNDFVSTLLQQ